MMDICKEQSLLLVLSHMKSLHLGELIKEIISNKNLTQSEVAQRMDMSRNGLHSTLNKENINTDLIRRFSKALDINLWETIYRETTQKSYDIADVNADKLNEKAGTYDSRDNSKETIQVTFTMPLDKKNELLRLLSS